MGLLSLCDGDTNATSVLLLMLLVMLLSTLYLLWPYSTFIRMGVPGPRPLPIVGNLHQHLKRGYHFDKECFKKYGDVWGVYEGRSPILVIADTKLLKTVMVKECYDVFTNHRPLPMGSSLTGTMFFSRGERWKRLRRLLTPALSGSKIRQMVPLVSRCTEQLLEKLQQESDSVSTSGVDAKRLFGAVCLDAILCAFFSLDVDSQKDPDNPLVLNAKALANVDLHGPLVVASAIFPFLASVLETLGVSVFPKRQMTYFTNLVRRLKQEREQGHQGRVDFMQLMVDSQLKGDGSTTQDHLLEKTLTDNEIAMQAIEFILGGYDTLGITMALLAYTLAQNPDVQRKLQEELDAALEPEATVTPEAVQGLEYLDMVVCETLRMYPVLHRYDRECGRAVQLGGLHVPAGITVVIPVRVIHHDPRHWPEPHVFRPERFSKEERVSRDPISFMPFGHGPRNCIGSRFALVIMKTMLSSILRRFSFHACADTPVSLEFTSNFFLEPVTPLLVRVMARTIDA